jgi:Flp pilus assembly protein TadG
MMNSCSNIAVRFRGLLLRFRREEDGALIIFGLMLFVLMIMMGGFAVDLMRYEYTRTYLQNTLDRSTLAAAALNQKMDPEAVVRDYMLKAGLSEDLASVTVTEGLNSRVVHSVGKADTHPIFLHMLGIDKFDALGRSQAEQIITNVEIVLVLDVSGSMNDNNKIGNLKIAASNFVDTVMANDINHRVSVTIVPYNAQVNIGPLLVSKFNITHPNGVANDNCVELPAETFVNGLPLSRTLPMPMMAYADLVGTTSKVDGFVAPTDATYAKPSLETSGVYKGGFKSAFCQPTTVNVVRLPSNDPAKLKAEINALQAGGNTSITLGMKWGVTLLDPSMRPMFNQFIASGDIPANMPDRPFNYDDPKAMKIVVLMTDGEHVKHDRITDAYKTGPSGIFRSTGDGYYSVRHTAGRPASAGSNEYYVPHLGKWQATAWDSGKGVVQQDWRDIWASQRLNYVAWQYYGRALGGTDSAKRTTVFNNTVSAMKATYAEVPAMDASLQQSCNAAKAAGVIVYGIAFEAPAHGQSVISSCASSAANYFAADGAEIKTAFQTIASNISMLKLTQ